jgi:hypothetical protein
MLIRNFVNLLLEGKEGFSIFQEIVIREIKSRADGVIGRKAVITDLQSQSKHLSRERVAKILSDKLKLKKYSDLIITLEVINSTLHALPSTTEKLRRNAVVLHRDYKIGSSPKEVEEMLIKAVFNKLMGKRTSITLKGPALELIKTGYKGEAQASTTHFGKKDAEELFRQFLSIMFSNVKPQPSGQNRFPDYFVSGRKNNAPDKYKDFLKGEDNIWLEAKTGDFKKSSIVNANEYLDKNGNFSLDKLNANVGKTMTRLGFGYPRKTGVNSLYFIRMGDNRVYLQRLKKPYIFQGKFEKGGIEVKLQPKTGIRSKEVEEIIYTYGNTPYFKLSKTSKTNPKMYLTMLSNKPFEHKESTSYPFSYFKGIMKPGPRPKKESVEYKLKNLLLDVNNVKT